jgi:hypothetical protein
VTIRLRATACTARTRAGRRLAHPGCIDVGQLHGQLATHLPNLELGMHRRLHVPARELHTLDRLVAGVYENDGAADMMAEANGTRSGYHADFDVALEPTLR